MRKQKELNKKHTQRDFNSKPKHQSCFNDNVVLFSYVPMKHISDNFCKVHLLQIKMAAVVQVWPPGGDQHERGATNSCLSAGISS